MVRGLNKRGLLAVVLVPVIAAVGAFFWLKPEPEPRGFFMISKPPTAEIRSLVAQLTSDPQSVAAPDARTVGPDGWFEDVPRGSTVEITRAGWLADDSFGMINLNVRPPDQYAYETQVHLRRQDERWLVTSIESQDL
ncbi:hypothetical protein [Kineosporia babensis]|uniref:Uncharacterized protein n=1 Tax=Kineosporia babensis TaxID=499548 RepID=A0A9X1NGX5_9ACTN|nr:hypothetical protein [Kineosporia babensis]MCD5313294.1 hypothetical protein [Kineosporia babensis]